MPALCRFATRHFEILRHRLQLRSAVICFREFNNQGIHNMSASEKPIKLSDTVLGCPENVWVRTVNLVREYQPVNLGQGFPEFPEVVSDRLKAALIKTQSPSTPVYANQYCRAQGHPDLVKAISEIYGPLHERNIDPMKEIIVTVGGYESLHCAITSVINPGDEVILIEPSFDSYRETVRMCNGITRGIPLKLKPGGTSSKDFTFDRDAMANAFNEKTKAVIINTPHNPTGKVFTREEIEFVADLCKQHNVLYISDEVYEWLLYDDNQHIRAATLPDMWERTLTIGSAGKAFNVTGWKIGWTIGPEYLISACQTLHQGIVFTFATPLQIALADVFRQERQLLGTKDSYWYWLRETLALKRDRMYKIASEAGLHPIMPDGGYFMLADVTGLGIDPSSDNDKLQFDQRMAEWMIKEKGIATIPVSVFFSDVNKKDNSNFIRFCFIKSDEILDRAAEKLKLLKK